MKNQILFSFILVFIIRITSAQITNTFPPDDSVGIGTTTPHAILEIVGDIRMGYFGQATLGTSLGIAFGIDALKANVTGGSNIAIGNGTLDETISGGANTAVGENAMGENISGSSNTAIGTSCLFSNVAGVDNTAMGLSSLLSNKNSSYNTAIGSQSMYFSFKGDYNVAVGYLSLFNNTKGDYNTAMGVNAMDFNTSGNNNTAIGYNADVSANNFTNATALGNGALVDASNKVRIGNASIISNGGQVEWTAYSDARIKTDVQENVPGLEFINLLHPITYHFDVDKQNQLTNINIGEKQEGMYDIEKIQFTGFLAQEVDAAAKKINYDFSGVDKSGEILGLRYAEFVVPLVKAVQELDAENASLQSSVSSLQNENADLEKRVEKLEKFITKQGIVLSDETAEQEISTAKVTLELTEAANELPLLGQNNPNPFNGKTSIQYFVPASAKSAQLNVTTQNGIELKTIELSAGNGLVEVDAKQIASGNYFYTLIIDGNVFETKQMILTK